MLLVIARKFNDIYYSMSLPEWNLVKERRLIIISNGIPQDAFPHQNKFDDVQYIKYNGESIKNILHVIAYLQKIPIPKSKILVLSNPVLVANQYIIKHSNPSSVVFIEDGSMNYTNFSPSKSPHPLAEYSYLLASSRRLVIDPELHRESAANYGIGATYDFTIGSRKLSLDAEYYYTRFYNQLMLNLDRDPHAAFIYSTSGRSYSHAVQVELTASPLSDLTLSLAWRLTDVRARYLNVMEQKPLTSRNKGLLTISYTPMMGLWQFDVSLALNGGGRMPSPYQLADGNLSWSPRYKAFTQLNAQITRNFRHWAIYLGGENLTNFRQKNPIVGASDPWGNGFDATMIYGPLHGAMVYIGFRYNFTKYL